MNGNPTVEKEIREILRAEKSAIRMSEKLFSPTGLFNQLANTEEERRQLTQTTLFKEAHERYHQLQEEESVVATSSGMRHDEMLKA
jgi:hypothetical protein